MDKITEREYQENEYQENTTTQSLSVFDFITKGLNMFLSSTVVYDLNNKKISVNYQNHTYTYDYKN